MGSDAGASAAPRSLPESLVPEVARQAGTTATAAPGAQQRRRTIADRVKIVTDSIRATEIREQDSRRGRWQILQAGFGHALRADARPAPSTIEREEGTRPTAHPQRTSYVTAAPAVESASRIEAERTQSALALDIPLLARPERSIRAIPAGSAAPAASLRSSPASHPPDRAGNLTDLSNQEQQRVLRVIEEYTRAFERLDVQATKAVYPSVDDESLRRAFHDLQGQQVRLGKCGVSISGSGRDASARCPGDLTYRPKIGSRSVRLTGREWTFNLSRDGGGWQILNATVQ